MHGHMNVEIHIFRNSVNAPKKKVNFALYVIQCFGFNLMEPEFYI